MTSIFDAMPIKVLEELERIETAIPEMEHWAFMLQADAQDLRLRYMEECVVLFCCVEKLDEKNPEHVIQSAKTNVMARLAKLKVNQVMIYPYAHLTNTLGSPDCALCIPKGLEKSLRAETIIVKRAPFGGYKEFEIRGKGHPLADLSMTICPYEGTECDFTCPYCHHRSRKRMQCMSASSPLNAREPVPAQR